MLDTKKNVQGGHNRRLRARLAAQIRRLGAHALKGDPGGKVLVGRRPAKNPRAHKARVIPRVASIEHLELRNDDGFEYATQLGEAFCYSGHAARAEPTQRVLVRTKQCWRLALNFCVHCNEGSLLSAAVEGPDEAQAAPAPGCAGSWRVNCWLAETRVAARCRRRRRDRLKRRVSICEAVRVVAHDRFLVQRASQTVKWHGEIDWEGLTRLARLGLSLEQVCTREDCVIAEKRLQLYWRQLRRHDIVLRQLLHSASQSSLRGVFQ